MTPKQIELVQTSFQKVVPVRMEVARLFYGRLFSLDPTLKRLFRSSLEEQGDKLTQTLARVVGSLHRIDQIIGAVRDLAVRHVDYGVEERHYDTVGEALLWTLEEGLGDAFTPEVRAAWTEAYTLLAGAMIEAVREAELKKTA